MTGYKSKKEMARDKLAQEPVTWAGVDFDINTTPPQRPWIGLTAEEAAECWTPTATQTWKNIENALRIKNT